MPSEARILVADDHAKMACLLRDQLTDSGFEVKLALGGAEAIAALRGGIFDLVLCDLRMGKVDGFDVLAAAREVDSHLPVLIMTAYGGVESAVEAMKRGAQHYFTKPFRLDEVLLYVRRALAERRLRDENRALRQVAAERSSFAALVGRSAPMRALYLTLERAAASGAPALIRGESGSGKELVARALHFEGPRSEQPFVALNCTALPQALLESELFGHVRGSFTGATAARRGLMLEADRGTLFLDEIGDMPAELQAKMLRVIEDGEVRAVGADSSRKVDVRVVAATHHDLPERIRQGQFRQDLFYRLNVIPIRVPPLRERREDVPMLVEFFLNRSRQRNPQSKVSQFSPEALAAVAAMEFPGNVRELENLVERLVVLGTGQAVDLASVRAVALSGRDQADPVAAAQRQLVTLRQLEIEYVNWVIACCEGNKTRAAEILGIDVSTIHRRERERDRERGNSPG